MQLNLFSGKVDDVSPDQLVACVAKIDAMHSEVGHVMALKDLMTVAVLDVLDADHDAACAALIRIKALVTCLAAHPAQFELHFVEEGRIPEVLTRAAAITPLRINDVFCPIALGEAALRLMTARGRA